MQLDGLRVLDFSIWRPGPYATQLLAERGADVIKVEPPGGDPMRVYPRLFDQLHAGKRSIQLDLKDPTDRATAHALASDADVAVEGYRPGVAARLGVGYDDLRARNPRLVYCSISGFGQTGPLAHAPGHDLNYLAWSGALAPEGREPAVPAIPVADLAGGMAAAFAICAAAWRQARTGEGEHLDVAMTDVLATWTGEAPPEAAGADPAIRGSAGYGLFATLDGPIALGIISEDHFWQPLCTVLGLDDIGGLGHRERMARVDELQSAIAAAVSSRPRAELVSTLLAAGVPVAPVLDRAGMLADEHVRHRGAVRRGGKAPALDEHRGATFR